MASRRTPLTAERLREHLWYAPETGVFTWKMGRGKQRVVGAVAGRLWRRYIGIRIDGVNYGAHRLAWFYIHGEWPAGDIDHINGCGDDNRLANIRDVSHSVNGQNQRRATAQSQTGFLGCHPHRDRFSAQITVDGRVKHLGLFDTPEAGHEAYLVAKRRLHEGCTI